MAALAVFGALAPGCDRGPEPVRIVAKEYRFEPSEITRSARGPVTLLLANGGSEVHEFTSLLLRDPRVQVIRAPRAVLRGESDSLRLLPGRSARVVLLAPPGTYAFHCRIRGHRGMQGLITFQ